MTTGMHVVSDVYCNQCSIVIGWTYVSPFATNRRQVNAAEEDQKYKIGKFILEKAYLTKKVKQP